MPISSIGGALLDVLFNPKYAGHIWKLTVVVDHLGNIVWIGPLMPGTAPGVIIWDKYGPSRKLGLFKDFEVGNHDGAYKGRMHSHTPFIGRKVLTKREREYNNVHGYYRARVEHLFARLWHWKVIRGIWMGSTRDPHANTHILLHFTQFQLCRQKVYQPYGPSSIWRDEEAPPLEPDSDDTDLCQLCAHKETSECCQCHLFLCNKCMADHLCDLPHDQP